MIYLTVAVLVLGLVQEALTLPVAHYHFHKGIPTRADTSTFTSDIKNHGQSVVYNAKAPQITRLSTQSTINNFTSPRHTQNGLLFDGRQFARLTPNTGRSNSNLVMRKKQALIFITIDFHDNQDTMHLYNLNITFNNGATTTDTMNVHLRVEAGVVQVVIPRGGIKSLISITPGVTYLGLHLELMTSNYLTGYLMSRSESTATTTSLNFYFQLTSTGQLSNTTYALSKLGLGMLVANTNLKYNGLIGLIHSLLVLDYYESDVTFNGLFAENCAAYCTYCLKIGYHCPGQIPDIHYEFQTAIVNQDIDDSHGMNDASVPWRMHGTMSFTETGWFPYFSVGQNLSPSSYELRNSQWLSFKHAQTLTFEAWIRPFNFASSITILHLASQDNPSQNYFSWKMVVHSTSQVKFLFILGGITTTNLEPVDQIPLAFEWTHVALAIRTKYPANGAVSFNNVNPHSLTFDVYRQDYTNTGKWQSLQVGGVSNIMQCTTCNTFMFRSGVHSRYSFYQHRSALFIKWYRLYFGRLTKETLLKRAKFTTFHQHMDYRSPVYPVRCVLKNYLVEVQTALNSANVDTSIANSYECTRCFELHKQLCITHVKVVAGVKTVTCFGSSEAEWNPEGLTGENPLLCSEKCSSTASYLGTLQCKRLNSQNQGYCDSACKISNGGQCGFVYETRYNLPNVKYVECYAPHSTSSTCIGVTQKLNRTTHGFSYSATGCYAGEVWSGTKNTGVCQSNCQVKPWTRAMVMCSSNGSVCESSGGTSLKALALDSCPVGSYCSKTNCKVESGNPGCQSSVAKTGYVCDGGFSTMANDYCFTVCGDGIVEGDEECDPSPVDETACTLECKTVTQVQQQTDPCVVNPASCQSSECGDGIITSDEQCDDGNQDSLDGCSGTCEVEVKFICSKNADGYSQCQSIYGTGQIEDKQYEDCDDGNLVNGDGCTEQGKIEDGYKCETLINGTSSCVKTSFTNVTLVGSTQLLADGSNEYTLTFSTQIGTFSIGDNVSASLGLIITGPLTTYVFTSNAKMTSSTQITITALLDPSSVLYGNDQEQLQVTLTNTTTLRTAFNYEFDKKVLTAPVLVKVPNQEIFKAAGQASQFSFGFILTITFMAQKIAGMSGEDMWVFLNSCQIINYLSLMSLYYPPEVLEFLLNLKFVNFKTKLIRQVITKIWALENLQNVELNVKFGKIGFDSQKIIWVSMQVLLVFVGISVFLFITGAVYAVIKGRYYIKVPRTIKNCLTKKRAPKEGTLEPVQKFGEMEAAEGGEEDVFAFLDRKRERRQRKQEAAARERGDEDLKDDGSKQGDETTTQQDDTNKPTQEKDLGWMELIKSKNIHGFLLKLLKYILDFFLWGAIIRMILEVYLDLSVSSMLNLRTLQWNYAEEVFSSLISIFVGGVLTTFMLWIFIFVRVKYKMIIKNQVMKDRYSPIVKSFKNGVMDSLYFYALFCLRRLVFAVSVTIFNHSIVTQMVSYIFLTSMSLIFSIIIMPYAQRIHNWINLFNEALQVVLFMFMIYFMDPNMPKQEKTVFGWMFIGTINVLILVNFLVILSIKVYKIYTKIRDKIKEWKASKKAKQEQAVKDAEAAVVEEQKQLEMRKEHNAKQLELLTTHNSQTGLLDTEPKFEKKSEPNIFTELGKNQGKLSQQIKDHRFKKSKRRQDDDSKFQNLDKFGDFSKEPLHMKLQTSKQKKGEASQKSSQPKNMLGSRRRGNKKVRKEI